MEGADTGIVTLAVFTDPGGEEATSDYGATVNWGDGTALDSSTPTIVANPNGTFSVQAHHTYAEESNPAVAGTNPYSILVTIRHDLAPNTTANDTANVSDPAVVITQSGFALTPVEGADTGIVTLTVFTNPGGAGCEGRRSRHRQVSELEMEAIDLDRRRPDDRGQWQRHVQRAGTPHLRRGEQPGRRRYEPLLNTRHDPPRPGAEHHGQ